ncbi:OFA family MFS transporter [Haloplanus pelagicus]|jgi:OFA family oxalate/formate antiporter-like MFS transporter|uniref:OFA family MFS transporter n=1 Tax=Haloplanus pelagicus TaxID=2949995 RepID=UPI00203E3AF9|nr:OFA family MFS transporter [Haloplanus sp. HW8-1]
MTDSATAPDFDYSAEARELLGFSRWWLIVAAGVMMGMVSPYQYVWSSIEGPLATSLGIPLPALGLVFTLFVVFQAGSQFPAGWWRDRYGPRRLTLLASVLVGGGYVGLAYATEVWQLYVLYSAGAVGVGIVYTIAVNTAIKWFPDRRGLTTGVGTMAFAAGSALFIPYVRANATPAGYADVLQTMGILMGACIFVGALVLQDPPQGWHTEVDTTSTGTDSDTGTGTGTGTGAEPEAKEPDGGVTHSTSTFTSKEMISTWQFWAMYAMFIGVSGAGLMLTAKIVSFAQNFEMATSVATASATVLPIAGGVGRLVIGDLSDRINRERAMAVSFVLLGLFLYLVVTFARLDMNLAFIAAVFLATFFWSPQYTLFPSVVGDYYGERHSSANYALLYSGKIWGGVFGGVITAWLVTQLDWTLTFVLGGTIALLSGIVALVLRPPKSGP